MFDIFQSTRRPDKNLFFNKADKNDVRLGETISTTVYENSEVVILGCPQDEGVRRNNGRIGAANAPQLIREQFYKLTTFGMNKTVFDLGDTIIKNSLEETHDLHSKIVEQILLDGKKIIVLGGGNDISFPDGLAVSNVFGSENWTALNIDAHLDVRNDFPRNSGTPYRQLLDGNFINPTNFYEVAFQSQAASPVYYDYLEKLKVNLICLEDFCKFHKQLEQEISGNKLIFWGFDVDSVRAADAPGVSAPSPIGLTAEEFCSLADKAGRLTNTKIIEFTEVNPNFDTDNRTTKLVAIAMHKFIAGLN